MRQMMNDLEAMRGLVAFYVGEDEATSSLSNVSLWTDLDAAKQLDTFRPMLDSAKPFLDKGGTFEWPIMNYLPMWELKPVGKV
jgi:hypothetical protein